MVPRGQWRGLFLGPHLSRWPQGKGVVKDTIPDVTHREDLSDPAWAHDDRVRRSKLERIGVWPA